MYVVQPPPSAHCASCNHPVESGAIHSRAFCACGCGRELALWLHPRCAVEWMIGMGADIYVHESVTKAAVTGTTVVLSPHWLHDPNAPKER